MALMVSSTLIKLTLRVWLLKMFCLEAVVGVLVGTGFELSRELTAADKKVSLLCCSVLDDMLFCEWSAPPHPPPPYLVCHSLLIKY